MEFIDFKMFPFIPLPKISTKTWLLKHASHRKHNEEMVEEALFYPNGSRIPTKRMIAVAKYVKCEDCNEVLFYDTALGEMEL